MLKKIILTIVFLVLLIGALVGLKLQQFQTMFAAGAKMTQPPATVTTHPVTADAWQPTLDAVGSVVAVQGVTVSAEVAGTVDDIAALSRQSCQRSQQGEEIVARLAGDTGKLTAVIARFDLDS